MPATFFWRSSQTARLPGTRSGATPICLPSFPTWDRRTTPDSGLFMKEDDMNQLEKVLYTAKVHTTGGRAGMSRSSDGHLEVKLSRPGSQGGTGTNPEQLF